jgi:hypothetical protein
MRIPLWQEESEEKAKGKEDAKEKEKEKERDRRRTGQTTWKLVGVVFFLCLATSATI